MPIDVYEIDSDLIEATLDAREVLEPVRQVWRDEDRPVDYSGDGYDWEPGR